MKTKNVLIKVTTLVILLSASLVIIYNLLRNDHLVYSNDAFLIMSQCQDHYHFDARINKLPLIEYDFPVNDSIVYRSPLLIRDNFFTKKPMILHYAITKEQLKYTIRYCGLRSENNVLYPYFGCDPLFLSDYYESTAKIRMSSQLLLDIVYTIYYVNQYNKTKTLDILNALEFIDVKRVRLIDSNPYVMID